MSGSAQAQHISIDGRLSPAQTLVGPSYSIGANLGKQVGGNLFHSFGIFGLATGESATFSGPATVTNVIGRVTGGPVIDRRRDQIDDHGRQCLPDQSRGHRLRAERDGQHLGQLSRLVGRLSEAFRRRAVSGDQSRRQHVHRRAAGRFWFPQRGAAGDHRQRQHAGSQPRTDD
jgi:hypothetical protein